MWVCGGKWVGLGRVVRGGNGKGRYGQLNSNTAKNHPLRLSEQRPSRLLYGARLPITYRALAP